MAVYKPYIKKENGSISELPLYATTAGEVVNLGYYDTITENADGTYTITRQTGYILLDGFIEKNASIAANDDGTTYRYTFDIVNGSGQNGDVISNLLTKILFSDLSNNGRTGIAMYSPTRCSICISGITKLDDYKAHLAKNNIYVQYKLATATTEKVEKNHYARYNERFILEHNKSEAEKSANLLNTFDRSNIKSNSTLYAATLNSDGSYTTNVSSDTRNWDYGNTDFRLHLTKGTYSFSITGKTISSNSNTGMRVIASNDSTLCTVHSGNGFKNSFTLTSDTDIGVLIKSYNSTDLKIMLNEGSTPLPYQPYNQSKHITNNEASFLKNESERSANVFDINTVTIGNGYDYTATASDWVKAIDIPVEPKTTYTASSIIGKYAFNHGDIVSDYNKNTITTSGDTKTLSIFIYVGSYSGTARAWFSNYMLNKGSVALAYQPYNQNKHITNNEAVFLKNESNRSANLWDEIIESGTLSGDDGSLENNSSRLRSKNFIPISGNTKYIFNKSYVARINFYDDSFNFISTWVNNKTAFITPSNAHFIKFDINSDYGTTYKHDIILNKGNVALQYQPYEGKVIHEKDLKNASTNLGHYDTITENPDGSYTITKQTGYVNGKDFLYWGINGAGNRYVTFDHIKANKNIENIIGNCGRVGPNDWWQSTFSKVTITYDGNNDFLIILLPNGTAENDTTALNDIHVQYKLPYTRTEIVEKNYCAQYNKRFILEHNKIEAEKSSNLWSYEQSITINAGSEKWWYLSNATLDAWGLVVGETYSIKSFVNSATKDLAFQLLPSYSDFKNGRSFVFTSGTQIRIGGNTVSSTVTFTPKISLVKGIDISDEYQPYVGRIIHMKDLENLPKLYNHFLIITFTHSSMTYKCKVNILSSVSTKITTIEDLASVCRGAKNIYETSSNNRYYWSMPAEGTLSNNETSTSQNYIVFRVFIYYDNSGEKIIYAYYINQSNAGSNFEIANSYSGATFSDKVTTIYGGQ